MHAIHRQAGQRRIRRQMIVRRKAAGFSLVELVVTLVILGIVAGIAVPSFVALTNSSRTTGTANEVVAAIQLARMESIRRNVRVTFCQSSDGATCGNSTPWRGWVVTADMDGDGVSDPDELVRAGTFNPATMVTASAGLANSRVMFRADGLAYNGSNLLRGNIRVCLPSDRPPENARDVHIEVGGRVSVRAAANVGVSCPTPASDA